MGRPGLALDYLVLVSPAPYVLLLILSVAGWLGPEQVAAGLSLLLLARACDAALALAREAEEWARAAVSALETATAAEPPHISGPRRSSQTGRKLAQTWTRALSDLLEADARPAGPMGYLLGPLGASLLEFGLGAVASMIGAARPGTPGGPLGPAAPEELDPAASEPAAPAAGGYGAVLSYAAAHPEDCLGGGVFPSRTDPAIDAMMGRGCGRVWELEGVRMYDASGLLSASYGTLQRERLPPCLRECCNDSVAGQFVAMAGQHRQGAPPCREFRARRGRAGS